MTDEADDRRSGQIDRIYRAIGRYVVEFSQLVFETELNVRMLAGERDRGVGVILAGLEANHIVRSFFALCAMSKEWTDEDRAVVRALRRETQTAIQTRNRIAHDAWFVGWGDPDSTDWSEAHRLQAVTAAKGYDIRKTTWTAADIDRLTDDLGRLRQLLWFLAKLSHPALDLEQHLGTPAQALAVDEKGRVQRTVDRADEPDTDA